MTGENNIRWFFNYMVRMSGLLTRSFNEYAFSFAFIGSILGLLALFFIVPYQCGHMAIESGGKYACEIGMGWYTFSFLLIFLAGYSGYWLYLRWCGEPGV
jgi:hypothetical protein